MANNLKPQSQQLQAATSSPLVISLLAQFPPLETVTRPTVDTAAAAYYTNRRPQTLRGWACHEDGPLRPIRINGRLAWSTGAIKQLLGVA